MVDVYLMRHAHVDYGEGVAIGAHNALTPLGHRMAAALAERALSWDLQYLFFSTMRRATETAEALRRRMPDLPCLPMDELRELSPRDLEDSPCTPPPDDLRAWSQEQLERANHRLLERVDRGWQRIRAVAAGLVLERVGVVAHGGSINALLRIFQGLHDSSTWSCSFDLDWASVSAIRYSETTARRYVLWVNDARHIDDLRRSLKD